ncbi:MAG: DMT family transporter [Rhizobiaceae bacterium]|nr:DMT family transporter [Rhizobiaceae bacterium]
MRAETAAPLSAILLVAASTFVFSTFEASAKFVVVAGVAPLFVAWVRYVVHVIAVVVFYRAWRDPAALLPRNYFLQIVRALCLFGATVSTFLALQTLQLAESVSIFFAAPMVITALAGPLLGEWAGWRRWLAVIAGFVGVLIIVRPGFGVFEIGHVYAFANMLIYACYAILTRRLGATESAQSMIFVSGLAPVILMLPLVPFYASLPTDAVVIGVFLTLGILGAGGHLLFILAYRQAEATALAPVSYLQMVWSIALGWLVFGDFPDRWVMTGAAIIMAGGIYIAHREHRLRLATRSAPTPESGEPAKKL